MRERSPNRRAVRSSAKDDGGAPSTQVDSAGESSVGFTPVNATGRASRAASKLDDPHRPHLHPHDSTETSLAFRESGWRPAQHGGSNSGERAGAVDNALPSTERSPNGGLHDAAHDSGSALSASTTGPRAHRAPRKRKDIERRDAEHRPDDVANIHVKPSSRETTKRRRTNIDVAATDDFGSASRLRTNDNTSSRISIEAASPLPDDVNAMRRPVSPPRSSMMDPLLPPRPETVEVLKRSLAETMGNPIETYRHTPSEHASSAPGAVSAAIPANSTALGRRPPAHISPEAASSPPEDEGSADEQLDESGPQSREAAEHGEKRRKRQFSNRTKTGCHTCRGRKKKCDERKPTCANCERGGFICGGYGPKPPGSKGHSHARTVMPQPLQSKHLPALDAPAGGSSSYNVGAAPERPYHNQPYATSSLPRPEESHTYHQSRPSAQHQQYAERPAYMDSPPPSEPNYGQLSFYRQHAPPSQAAWHQHERAPPPPYGQERMTSNYPNIPPPSQALPPLPPPPLNSYEHNPLLPTLDPWLSHSQATPYRPGGPSSSSYASSSTGRPLPVPSAPPFDQLEKDKMLRGLPFKHWKDSTLIEDRRDCEVVLERWNQAKRASACTPEHDLKQRFREILQPQLRRGLPFEPRRYPHTGPQGSYGDRTIVHAPFDCMYGYNLRLGHDVVIEKDCYFQDAAQIWIGDRVTIGDHVHLLCIAVNPDPRGRSGSQGETLAGAIRIEDGATICSSVRILPYRTIGKGSIVAAGAVVTKDVRPNTLVAGVPARLVRYLEDEDTVPARRGIEVEEQNEAVKRRMNDLANHGWRDPSDF